MSLIKEGLMVDKKHKKEKSVLKYKNKMLIGRENKLKEEEGVQKFGFLVHRRAR